MDVRVVGSGPAGLMAAEVLAEGGAKVTIIDHHASPARKFLLAGRGGLNLTHSEPLEKLLSHYGAAQARLDPIIRSFPPDALRVWADKLGAETFVGTSGRVFPKALKASPLLRAWLRRLGDLGVQLKLKTAWTGFDDMPTVLAMGGASWPELGSDGAWRGMFEQAGIAVGPFVPSNVRLPVEWSAPFAEKFAGMPIKNVAISLGDVSVRGEVMIAEDGIEGGAIYAISRAFRQSSTQVLHIDLRPDLTKAEVERRMMLPRGKDSRSTFLRKKLNLSPAAIGLMRELSSESPKCVELRPTGVGELRRAISTAGGVAWKEIGDELELLKRPNTFVVGEMVDWDAPTGGYLLQASMAMGRWAGDAMLKRWKQT